MEEKAIEVNIDLLIGPVVYLLYKNEICMYVGSSKHGGVRYLSPNHKAVSDLLYLDRTSTRLFVIPCKTENEAFVTEGELIKKLRPIRNLPRGGGSKKRPRVHKGKGYLSLADKVDLILDSRSLTDDQKLERFKELTSQTRVVKGEIRQYERKLPYNPFRSAPEQ